MFLYTPKWSKISIFVLHKWNKAKLVFLQHEGDVFILCAQNKHHDTCPQSFQLQNDANFTPGWHLKVQVKKHMLVELCAGNYATHDGLVNGVDGIFQG
jgi:hypothetical protein